MGRLFDAHYHLWRQNNIIINGRLVNFIIFKPPLRILLLDMDKSKRFYVLKIQTKKYENWELQNLHLHEFCD